MKREEELTVSVKPLEWKEIDLRVANPPMVIWEAKTPFVNYTLESVMDRPWFCHFICAHFTDLDEAKAAAQADYEARIRSALISTPKREMPEDHGLPPYPTGDVVGPCVCGSRPGGPCLKCEVVPATPKPEPVGWETDAEWDLEMRCFNITENTPFDEVSKLINDLWQQYCLAAEPKPEATEGVDRQVHQSKPVVSQNTQIVEDKATEGISDGQIYARASRNNVPDEIVQASLDKARKELIAEDAMRSALAAYRTAYDDSIELHPRETAQAEWEGIAAAIPAYLKATEGGAHEKGWQSMDAAPLDGKHCILAVKEGAFFYSVQGAYQAGQWNAVHRDNVEPLCWMPNVRLPDYVLGHQADNIITSRTALTAKPEGGAHEKGWQPIETAPKGHRQDILIFDRGVVRIAWWGAAAYNRKTKEYDLGWTNGGTYGFQPSHWMPLPSAPAALTAKQTDGRGE